MMFFNSGAMIAAVVTSCLFATGAAAGSATLKQADDDRPRPGASALSHTGQGGQTAGRGPSMSDAEFYKICKKQGGGASTTETGNRTCRDADGNPVLVPFPIPID